MIKTNSLFEILVFLFLLSWNAQAKQDSQAASQPASQSASGPKKQKFVKVRFDDELVKGATEKPDGLTMNVKKEFNYKKLIRIRENFINEMENGLDDFNDK